MNKKKIENETQYQLYSGGVRHIFGTLKWYSIPHCLAGNNMAQRWLAIYAANIRWMFHYCTDAYPSHSHCRSRFCCTHTQTAHIAHIRCAQRIATTHKIEIRQADTWSTDLYSVIKNTISMAVCGCVWLYAQRNRDRQWLCCWCTLQIGVHGSRTTVVCAMHVCAMYGRAIWGHARHKRGFVAGAYLLPTLLLWLMLSYARGSAVRCGVRVCVARALTLLQNNSNE